MSGNQIFKRCKRCHKIIRNRDSSAEYCLDCLKLINNERDRQAHQELRTKLKKHLNQRCAFCKNKGSEKHYLDLDKKNNNRENVIKVCRSCHIKIHRLILNPFLKQMVKILKENRYSISEIAKILNLSSYIVYKHLKG